MNSLQIKVIASSSSGNCYSISDGTTTLLIECGTTIKKIKKALNFRLQDVSGCLITHEHQDHCKAVRDVMKAGIDCYLSAGTIEALKLTGHRLHPIEHSKQITIGTWKIVPFNTVHHNITGERCAEPLGFLMGNGKQKLLFATDTAYIRPRFKGLTHIMIESNYQTYILENNILTGAVPFSMKNRLLFSHFSLDNVLKFLEDTDRSKLQEIHLLHLSAGNSNQAEMEQAVGALCGIPVYVAKER